MLPPTFYAHEKQMLPIIAAGQLSRAGGLQVHAAALMYRFIDRIYRSLAVGGPVQPAAPGGAVQDGGRQRAAGVAVGARRCG